MEGIRPQEPPKILSGIEKPRNGFGVSWLPGLESNMSQG
ncbi:MAG: hypothetical protein RL178_525 [Pseudomonadota bacterium]|jgi:hypothetical protein